MQNIHPHTCRTHSVHKKNGQANMLRQAQLRIHMDAQANTQTDRPVYADISTHNTYTTHKHTTLLFYQVSLCLAGEGGGVRLSEQ